MSTQLQAQAKVPPAIKPIARATQSSLLQRQCACGGSAGVDGECAECRAKRLSMKRQAITPAATSQAMPPIVHEVLSSPGHSLDTSTRAFMEPRFGHDFSKVRVHTDAKAAQSAQSVNALAYTVGRDMAFGTGQYSPNTSEGKRLLAHELTHVVQQKNNRPELNSFTVNLDSSDSPAEQEAEAMAHSLESSTRPSLSGRSANGLQRAPKGSKAREKKGHKIEAEDVGNIITIQLGQWYNACVNGVTNATLNGDDEGAKWFAYALVGNLVWAATAFVNPAASFAIRIMSVGGAAVGSGTLEQLLKEELPTNEFRQKAAYELGQKHETIVNELSSLTGDLEALYYKKGLTDRNNKDQVTERRRVAWQFLFGDVPGYANPEELKASMRKEIESIWKEFLPCWRSLQLPITPTSMKQDMRRSTMKCYFNAVVRSGVADRAKGVRKTTIYPITPEGQTDLQNMKDIYEFPGGAKVTKTHGPHDFWYGDVTTELP